jgi:hypothetical protein
VLVKARELLDLQGGQDFAHCSRIAYSSVASAIAARWSLRRVLSASRVLPQVDLGHGLSRLGKGPGGAVIGGD